MSSSNYKCLLCLLHNSNVKNVLSEDVDGILLQEKLKYVMSEENIHFYYNNIVNYNPQTPKTICIECFYDLNHVYKFKQKCFQSLKYLSDSIEQSIAINNQKELRISPNNLQDTEHVKIKEEILDSVDKSQECQIEKVRIKVEPGEIQENVDNFAKEVQSNNLEEVLVKGEPEDLHSEIEIKEDQLVAQENSTKFILDTESTSNTSVSTPVTEEPRPYQCIACPSAFKRSSHLKRHFLTHTGEKPFTCDICAKAFCDQTSLMCHKRTHSDEKPYQCDICGKTFKQKGQLVQHKLLHTGEKPYKCDMCDKAYAHTRILTIHKRTHSGEKPFKCTVCEKAFVQLTHLKKHLLRHTGEKAYKCDVCQKAFLQKTHLQKHQFRHTGERPFGCEMCSYKCTTKGGLKSHMQRIHEKDEPKTDGNGNS